MIAMVEKSAGRNHYFMYFYRSSIYIGQWLATVATSSSRLFWSIKTMEMSRKIEFLLTKKLYRKTQFIHQLYMKQN